MFDNKRRQFLFRVFFSVFVAVLAACSSKPVNLTDLKNPDINVTPKIDSNSLLDNLKIIEVEVGEKEQLSVYNSVVNLSTSLGSYSFTNINETALPSFILFNQNKIHVEINSNTVNFATKAEFTFEPKNWVWVTENSKMILKNSVSQLGNTFPLEVTLVDKQVIAIKIGTDLFFKKENKKDITFSFFIVTGAKDLNAFLKKQKDNNCSLEQLLDIPENQKQPWAKRKRNSKNLPIFLKGEKIYPCR